MDQYDRLTIPELRRLVFDRNINLTGLVTKEDLIAALMSKLPTLDGYLDRTISKYSQALSWGGGVYIADFDMNQQDEFMQLKALLNKHDFQTVKQVWLDELGRVWFINPNTDDYLVILDWRNKTEPIQINEQPQQLTLYELPDNPVYTREQLLAMSDKEFRDAVNHNNYYGIPLSGNREQAVRSFLQAQNNNLSTLEGIREYLANDTFQEAELAEMVEVDEIPDIDDYRAFAKSIKEHHYLYNNEYGLIEPIMKATPEQLTKVLEQLGYAGFVGTVDDAISLIWWHYIIDESLFYRYIQQPLVRQILGMSVEDLMQLLPQDYDLATDKASIISFILEGVRIPIETVPRDDSPEQRQRYASISSLDGKTILALAYMYGYVDSESPSMYSPLKYVVMKTPSVMEPYLIANINNLEALAQSLGMIIPEGIDRDDYIIRNLGHYENVLLRRQEEITDYLPADRDQLVSLLSKYTDAELAERFEMLPEYLDRKELVEKLADLILRGEFWHIRKTRCNNMDELLPATYDTPADVIAEGKAILSYGTIDNYQCYSVEELLLNFREGEDGFQFLIPGTRDEFSIESMKELVELLDEIGQPEVYGDLINKIHQGLQEKTQEANVIRKLQRDYLNMSSDRKALVREYLVWLFTTGMRMRFWKGPGHPYPYFWVESDEAIDHRCDLATRDRNVMNTFTERTNILNRMPEDLERWVLDLPRVKYNFRTETSNMSTAPDNTRTINYVVELAQLGDFCLADASDRLIQTAYYLITKILGLDLNGFNRLISNVLGIPNRQPPFIPYEIVETGHVDPNAQLD
jgi:hypothetical protein